ncbi:MAG: vWA domain-containing protein [Myxococcota bacterium]
MQYEDDRDRSSPFIPNPEAGDEEAMLPEGWEAAIEYHRLKRIIPEGRVRARVREAAISAVLQQAMECVRHASRPMRIREQAWQEAPGGDIDLEQTLDAGYLLEPEDPQRLRVLQREAREADVVLILDMSLSMTGEKIALVAVATTVLAFTLPAERLGLVVFDSQAHVLKRLGEVLPLRELVRRLLEFPAKGYTHLSDGLRKGLEVLREGRQAVRCGVLMSDGVYNVGWDPAPLATLYPRLHVIQVGEGDVESRDKGLSRRMASNGRGRYARAERYEELPSMTWRLVQDLFR